LQVLLYFRILDGLSSGCISTHCHIYLSAHIVRSFARTHSGQRTKWTHRLP